MMQIQYSAAKTTDELQQILLLQKENLRHKNDVEEEREQGFVTVQHDIELLTKMNQIAPHIIATDGDNVIGYALAMTKHFRDEIPVLHSMFVLLDDLMVEDKKLGTENFLVMGQICIDKNYRGKGIFQGLYAHYFQLYKPNYTYIITEVAERNVRSLQAHFKVGFKDVHRYDEPGFETWVVLMY
jgi:GNAT superfamily N-acetyltransferase